MDGDWTGQDGPATAMTSHRRMTSQEHPRRGLVDTGVPRLWIAQREIVYEVAITNLHPTTITVREHLLITATKTKDGRTVLERQVDEVDRASEVSLPPRSTITCDGRFLLWTGVVRMSFTATLILSHPEAVVPLPELVAIVESDGVDGSIRSIRSRWPR